MAIDELVADRARDGIEVEASVLGRELRQEHDLEQQVAELVAQILERAALQRIDDLARLFQRVRRERGVVLLQIPGAAGVAIAQAGA